jgi:hypothetical protein
MCKANKFFLCFLFASLFTCFAGVLQAEEPDRWYLISEAELRSIEQYRENSEREKQNWLLQARELRRGSADLNVQLAQARERNMKLEQSFNELEADRLTLLSLKNGEIAALKQEAADNAMEAEKWKGKNAKMLAVIIALAMGFVGFFVILLKQMF